MQVDTERLIKELNDMLATANYQLALHKALVSQLNDELEGLKAEKEIEND